MSKARDIADGSRATLTAVSVRDTSKTKVGSQGMSWLTDADRYLYDEATATYTQDNNGYWQNIKPFSSSAAGRPSVYMLNDDLRFLEDSDTFQPHRYNAYAGGILGKDYIYGGPVSGDGTGTPVRLIDPDTSTTTYQYFQGGSGGLTAKWGKDKVGSGAIISYAIVPDGTILDQEEDSINGGASDFTLLGFDPKADIEAVFRDMEAECNVKFEERVYDPYNTLSPDILIACLGTLGGGTLAYTYVPRVINSRTEYQASNETNTTLAGNMMYDGSREWYSDAVGGVQASTAFNFRFVFRHEMLHAMGLAHLPDTDSVVYPYVSTGSADYYYSDGDIAGLQYLYGLPLIGSRGTEIKTSIDSVEKTVATFMENQLYLGEGVFLNQNSLQSDKGVTGTTYDWGRGIVMYNEDIITVDTSLMPITYQDTLHLGGSDAGLEDVVNYNFTNTYTNNGGTPTTNSSPSVNVGWNTNGGFSSSTGEYETVEAGVYLSRGEVLISAASDIGNVRVFIDNADLPNQYWKYNYGGEGRLELDSSTGDYRKLFTPTLHHDHRTDITRLRLVIMTEGGVISDTVVDGVTVSIPDVVYYIHTKNCLFNVNQLVKL